MRLKKLILSMRQLVIASDFVLVVCFSLFSWIVSVLVYILYPFSLEVLDCENCSCYNYFFVCFSD